MKSVRYLFGIIAMAISLYAVADKKMTIRNADTGESFEETIPDGLRIYEYNGNWLDSIPYLMEHARWGEPWAYEALAECHHYGKSGLKKSIFNALFYYDLAGKNIEDYTAEIEQANNDDQIAVISRLFDYIAKKDSKRIVCAIDTLNEADYHSADVLLKFIDNPKQVELEAILEFATDAETDLDASVFACAGYALSNKMDSVKIDISWVQPLIMEKIPYFYSLLGKKKYEDTIKSESSDGYAEDATAQDIEDRRKAAEYFLKADEYGVLTREAARLLYHYCTQDPSSNWVNIGEEDLYRIGVIAGAIG